LREPRIVDDKIERDELVRTNRSKTDIPSAVEYFQISLGRQVSERCKTNSRDLESAIFQDYEEAYEYVVVFNTDPRLLS